MCRLKSRLSWSLLLLSLVSLLASALPAFANNTVSITVFENHKRYVEASESYGISWKLFELATQHAKYQLELQPSSWRASMKRIKDGKVDMVFGALKTAEREKWASFSLPLIAEGSAIFTQPNNPVTYFDDIDLENSTIGVSANSLQETLAKELGFKNIYSTVHRPQLYDMLKGNRLDYLFFGTSIINYYCVNYNKAATPKCMKQVSEDFHPSGVHTLALSNNSAAVDKLNHINQALVALRHSKELKAVFEQYASSDSLYEVWLKSVDAWLAEKN